jgi:hypothetical protein
VVDANLEKMSNELIFPRKLKTAYFLHLKSISGILRVLTTLESTILENSLFLGNLNFHRRNIKTIYFETALNFASDRL